MTTSKHQEEPEKRASKQMSKEWEEPPEKWTTSNQRSKEREELPEKWTTSKRMSKEWEEPPEKQMKATAFNTTSNETVEGI